MDASYTIQDNIHLSKLNIYVSIILDTHQINIFYTLTFELFEIHFVYIHLHYIITYLPNILPHYNY